MGIKEAGNALLFVLIETHAADLVLETGLTGRKVPVNGGKRLVVNGLF